MDEHRPRHARRRRMVRALTIAVATGIVLVGFAFDWVLGGAPGIGRMQMAVFALGACVALTTLLPYRWNVRTLLLTMGALGALLPAEIGARLIAGERYRPLCVPDDELIFRPLPESSRGDVHINSNGYRGPELRINPTSRIVVYGDSFIEASYTAEDATFVGQLRQHLDTAELINAGVAGYGPDQCLIRMRQELAELKPQVVVLGIFTGNDFGDLIRNRLFQRQEEKIVEKRVRLSLRLEREFQRKHRWPVLLHLINGAIQNRHFASVNNKEHWLGVARADFHSWQEGAPVILGADHYEWDIAVAPGGDSAIAKRQLMHAALLQIRNCCDQHRVPLLVVIIPAEKDIVATDPELPDDGSWAPKQLSTWVEESCNSLSIAHVSLFNSFEPHGQSLYFSTVDNHWNETGQKLAADIVARRLRKTVNDCPEEM